MDKNNMATYRASYYKGNEKKLVWADSKEELFAKARADMPDAKDNALMYVSRYNQENSAYEMEGRYLFVSGRDVTQIKLNIAPMPKEQFDEVKDHIKEMGAEFDLKKKSWYVLRSDDNKDMIEAYLKAQAEKSNAAEMMLQKCKGISPSYQEIPCGLVMKESDCDIPAEYSPASF